MPVSTIRAVIPTVALLLTRLPPPSTPRVTRPRVPEPTATADSSTANWVTDPMMIASTPSSRPMAAADFGSARLLFEKFCSFSTASRALRSMSE